VRAILPRDSVIYVGGDFSNVGGQPRLGLAALDPRTGLATPWNPSNSGYVVQVFGLAAVDTTLYVAGFFAHMGGPLRSNLAAVSTVSGLATDWNPGADRTARRLLVEAGVVYVAGDFRTVGGQSRTSLAAIDAQSGLVTSWNPVRSARSIPCLAARGSTLYIGGDVQVVGSEMGNEIRGYIAAIDMVTGAPSSWAPQATFKVHALAVDDSMVVAGGEFASIGGRIRWNLAAFDVTTGRLTDWEPGVLDGAVYALAVDSTTVYAGGWFDGRLGGVARYLAAFDRNPAPGTSPLRDWHPSPDGQVTALSLQGTTLYVGGDFRNIGGQPRVRLAALDAMGNATPWDPSPSPPLAPITALAAAGSDIYVGGYFDAVGGQPRRGVAALDTATGQATAWNASLNRFGVVRAFAVTDSVLYLGGGFTTVGDQLRRNLAAVDRVTGRATPWNPFPDQIVTSLMLSGRALYVGTGFSDFKVHSVTAFEASSGAPLDWSWPMVKVGTMTGDDRVLYVGHYGAAGVLRKPRFTLTRQVVGHGVVSWSPDEVDHAGADLVTATAVPDPGWTFMGWEGDATGNANPIVMSMIRDRTVTATFADTTPPVPHVEFPGRGESIPVDAETTLVWAAADGAGVASVDLRLSRHGLGGPFETIASGIENTGAHLWRVTGPPTTDALLEVVARDPSGNVAAAVGGRFTISSGSPRTGAANAVVSFALGSPVPNPAEREALISFDVPSSATVRIALHDIHGRHVAWVAGGWYEPGRYTAVLDVSRLRLGLYFVRMQAPGADLRRRLVVRK
jgi:hypothetical protein